MMCQIVQIFISILLLCRLNWVDASTRELRAKKGGSNSPKRQTASTCPHDFCGNVNVTTMPPTGCNKSLSAVKLAIFKRRGDVLIEMLGPADPTDAAAVVISVPHGGDLKPSYIPDRSTSDSRYCPSSGCKMQKDSNTIEIALAMKDSFIDNYCKVPYVVINHLHRSKLDANREVVEAAQGNKLATKSWKKFHNFISIAQKKVKKLRGTVVGSTGQRGVKGLLFDVHGYAGFDWVPGDGAPFIQWGYRLSSTSLNSFCPLDDIGLNSDGSFTHARSLPDHTLECLVRGKGSLADRITPVSGICGSGLPSSQYPDPRALALDCDFCADMCGVNPDHCHYFSSGYDVKVHEYLNWKNSKGILFNGVQAEFPRCIRFDKTARSKIANSLSIAICSFMQDLFGESEGTC